MKIRDFGLEVYFGKHEFTAPYLLTQSDCESMTTRELLSLEPGAEKRYLDHFLGYTEVPGSPELRQILAGLYEKVDSEGIIVHAGAQEPIFNFMNVFLSDKDHVICQYPIYQSLHEVARAIGAEVSKWNIEMRNNEWALNLKKLEELIKPNTKLIVLNSPNNPTGYCLTKEEMLKIAEIAKKHGIYVFCDEVYKGTEIDGIKRPWFADIYEKGISLGVLSKAYGLAGLRIGWIATQASELIEPLKKMKHYTSICSSAPSEFLAIVAIKNSAKLLERNLQIIKKNIAIAEEFFNRYPDKFNFHKPMAGPVAFVELKSKKPVQEYCDELVEKHGILLMPAPMFGSNEQYFRMGFGKENFATNLAKFEDIQSRP